MNIQASDKNSYRIYRGRKLLATVRRLPASDQVEIKWAGGGVSIACNLRAAMAILAAARVSKPLR